MHPSSFFKFCPRCGQPRSGEMKSGRFHCPACDFLYFFNPASAVAAFITDDDHRVLFIERGKDPAKGKWAVPGGFIDAGETAEAACRREIREEVNLELTGLRFLCSQTNEYFFHAVTYSVLDLFFVAKASAVHHAAALDEVRQVAWLKPGNVALEDLAFPSMREAMKVFLERG